jgi:alpha-galactosidase
MTKITFIGAGSLGFTGELVRDILTFPLLRDSHIALMDIDAERLDFARTAVKKIITEGKYPATMSATLDRVEALRGADFVLTTILSGSTEVWRHDIEIPKKYGIDINVGDTRGPSGIFRFLRTINPMMDIVRDMEKVCPNAVLLNYTNPMAMLVSSIQKQTLISTTGLCHSVQGTAMMLAEWIGAPYEEIDYTCAGINHQAWYLDYKWKGQDAYPLIHKAITERPEINSEYNWWFRKRPDLIEKYCTHGTNWNPGEYAYILKEYQYNEATWKDQVKERLAHPLTAEDLERGQEYAAYIINALKGGEPFKFNGNVQNTKLISNLPEGACVEVLTQLSSGIEEMAIQASLAGDPTMVYRAICHDPLTASVLSLAEIRQMTNELFAQHQEYLPQFKITQV